MDRDNTEIGKYKILGQVGEGAMGVVYRALDPVLNRTVAIKVMSDSIARDDDLRGRFLREAQAAGSLQHPNVITIYDCGEIDGHLFIAMEFVEGEDLEEVLKKQVDLSLVDKIDIIVDVLGGLSYAHKRGIVHRDIKPANIRIDEDGRARIMDFGIAHLSSSNMTRTGVMVGTPAYMAPEQIVGGTITPATDLFSVGAVLYELLTGVKPFNADTLQSVMYKIVSQPPPELPADSAAVPAAMKDVLHKALAKDAANRYESAVDMANALTSLRAGLSRDSLARKSVSLRSVIDTALADERASKTRTANRRGLVIGGSIAVGVAAVVVALVVFTRGEQTKQGPTPPVVTTAPTASAPPEIRPGSGSGPVAQSSSTPAPATPSPPASAAGPGRTGEKPAPSRPKAGKTGSASSSISASTAATSRELGLVRSLRTTAVDNRKRAADAGATPDQLQSGDDHLKAADSLMANGRISDAADHLAAATSAWAVAEHDARAAAAAAAAAARQRAAQVDAPKPPSVPQPSAPTGTKPAPATAAAPPVIPAPAPANPSADIRTAVAAYARAIESRNVAEVRREYPEITASQAKGWEQFFGSVQSLRASLSISSLDISGNAAEARISGEYDYVTSAGKPEHQPVVFQATLKREGSVWKFASVR